MTDKFFIDHNKQMTTRELSKALFVAVGVIDKYRESQPVVEHIAKAKKDNFFRKSGSCIMTKEQADKNDQNANYGGPSSMESCIHRMKDRD